MVLTVSGNDADAAVGIDAPDDKGPRVGDEDAAEVIDGPRSAVFQQGHNRLHAARGALAHLAGVRPNTSSDQALDIGIEVGSDR